LTNNEAIYEIQLQTLFNMFKEIDKDLIILLYNEHNKNMDDTKKILK